MAETWSLPDSIDFVDRSRAARCFAEVARALGGGAGRLRPLLLQSPDPDAALSGLARLVESGPEGVEAVSTPGGLVAALTVFANSRFLSETVIRYPKQLGWALDPARFHRVLTADELRAGIGTIRADFEDAAAALHLVRFKRMQLLRIALRDFLGEADLAQTALELSNLADAIIEAARDHIRAQLTQRFGRPFVTADSGEWIEGRSAVLALGKLGGRELNYSSDIDLFYLHTGDGETAGPVRTANHDFYNQLATRLTAMLSHMTPEGFAYRVDLRLRPEGSAGELVASLAGAAAYYHDRARDWELQMLIKARPVAGDLRLGKELLRLVQPLIYRTSTDFSTIEKVSESRDRIQKNLRRRLRGRPTTDVKLHRGGIRDIEFLAQCLQRLYGGRDPFVRSGGTLFALHRLHEKGYLSMPDYSRLSAAYHYLRTVEHRLQLVDDRQTHELPKKAADLAVLERQMLRAGSPAGGEGLEAEIAAHFEKTAAVYERIVHSQKPTETIPEPDADEAEPVLEEPDHAWRASLRHLEKRSAALAAAVSGVSVKRGSKAFGHFLDRVIEMPEVLDALEEYPAVLECAADLFEHSPYLGQELARYPQDLLELTDVAGEAGVCDPSGDERRTLRTLDDHPDAGPLFDLKVSAADKAKLLRRIYRRRMLRLLADSLHQGRPVFQSLARTSDIGDWVIRSAYRIAMEEMTAQSGPRRAPAERLQVVALGRLGMREFDLGSDADLVYVLPDAAREDVGWWTSFVARMTDIISSYTAEGMIFSVDARLRPRGRDGDLVQTETAFQAYFREGAEAWEALAYLKARAVAGDIEHGTRVLAGLQEIAWQRYGLREDSAELLTSMREKLEKEQGAKNPLKAGPGGYYDIDFILLYLRLKTAKFFVEYLSTPERVEIVRLAGELSDEQADFLRRAATFFRALDHGVRTATGQSSALLPAARPIQDAVGEMMARWGAIRLSAQPLPSVVRDVRERTRALYSEIFMGRGSGAK